MIHGIFYRTSQYTTQQLQPSILDGSHPVLTISPEHQHIVTWNNQRCWLAEGVDKQIQGPRLTIETHSHWLIVAWARLDNRQELANRLSITSKQLALMSDIQLILQAYLHYKEACTTHLFGDYCFAIYNQQSHTLFCARDHMGAKPFYYYMDSRLFVFSSSLSLFHVLEDVPVRPRTEWASRFMLSNMSMDFHKTPYDQILKLPPANQLLVTERDCSKKQYFSFHTNKIEFDSPKKYIELYQEHLEQAIINRVRTDYPLGSEISGGLDSSTVTSYAAKYYSKPRTDFFTFGFARTELEPHYILQVNQQSKITNSFICCHVPASHYKSNRELIALGAPFEHGNSKGHEVFYDMAAKHQVRTLLSGFGGDEFVTSIHGDMCLYELLKAGQYVKLYNKFGGGALKRALRLGRFWYNSKNKAKVSRRMREAFDSRWEHTIITDQLVSSYGLKEAYEKLGDFDNGYSSLDQFTLEQRWAPFVATRMENCTLMAASYGVDYRWPLLDVRLIQCFLSIPSSEKFHKGIDRYLHRAAVQDVVPKSIVWKNSKYIGEVVRVEDGIKGKVKVNEDLHPDLLPLLDMNKLAKQQRCLSEATGFDLKNMPLTRNTSNINKLDEWLKYYFPKGCSWVNT